jgi:NADH:ubiquinone oxidoreductase subunit 6 (subunit J)
MGDAVSQVSNLVENEIELAKAEAGEKVALISTAAVVLACGAVLVIPALVMVLFALSAELVVNGWSPPAAYLVSALIAAVLAAIMFIIGSRKMDAIKRPSETMRELGKDKDTIKGFAQ